MCTICALTIEFAVDHPQTLAVAVATRQAIEEGELPEGASEDMDMARSRHQATVLLTTMQQRLEQVLSTARLLALPDFFVLMIESRTWGYFHPTLGGFDTLASPSAPRLEPDVDGMRDSVIVISQVAAGALTQGRLPFARASGMGVSVVDALDAPAALIRSAFTTAYPAGHFSQFVCTEVA
jgi:hypothetical protein